MGVGQRKLLRPCIVHVIVLIRIVGRQVSPRHRSEDSCSTTFHCCLLSYRGGVSSKRNIKGPPACDVSLTDPTQPAMERTVAWRPTGPVQLQVHSQITLRISKGTNEDPSLSLSGVLFVAHSRWGVLLDFMSHVIFGSSANRQIGIPSPLHGPGLDSQLTEVSEASISPACLLGRRTFLRLIAKRSQKERWLVTISISPTSGYQP